MTEFIEYFSHWRNGKLLLATSMCWFLLDIAYVPPLLSEGLHLSYIVLRFYGINLNQNVVLQQIGFDGKTGTPWEKMFNISTGNIIITVLGFVPGMHVFVAVLCDVTQILTVPFEGYYATIFTIEKLGRKWIQIQGFLLAALFRESRSLLVSAVGYLLTYYE